MRIRTKKWARPELAKSPYFLPNPEQNRNRWRQQFQKDLPLHAEFGCGKGVSLAKMAKNNPEINYIGVDLSMDILGVARRNVEAFFQGGEVPNLLLTSWNLEASSQIFGSDDALERIYIYFCNPWSRPRHHKRRLTHPRQLMQYREFLAPKGEIYFKTDDDGLFRNSLAYFKDSGFSITFQTKDLHNSDFLNPAQSEHEIMFSQQNIPIKFLIAKKE